MCLTHSAFACRADAGTLAGRDGTAGGIGALGAANCTTASSCVVGATNQATTTSGRTVFVTWRVARGMMEKEDQRQQQQRSKKNNKKKNKKKTQAGTRRSASTTAAAAAAAVAAIRKGSLSVAVPRRGRSLPNVPPREAWLPGQEQEQELVRLWVLVPPCCRRRHHHCHHPRCCPRSTSSPPPASCGARTTLGPSSSPRSG